jgi:aryl-alcohol dehydrogenase-like predicted oxidoreductase
MRYRHLGDSGLQVSELCMGTMTFGHKFGVIGVVGSRRVRDDLEAVVADRAQPRSGEPGAGPAE